LLSYQYLIDENEFTKLEGKLLADILGLPTVWPPDEQ